MHVGNRLTLLVLLLLYFAGIVMGFAYAVFGSRSDVNSGEQLAALFYGIGMIAFGGLGFGVAAKVKSNGDLKVPLICAVGALVSFLLVIAFGP